MQWLFAAEEAATTRTGNGPFRARSQIKNHISAVMYTLPTAEPDAQDACQFLAASRWLTSNDSARAHNRVHFVAQEAGGAAKDVARPLTPHCPAATPAGPKAASAQR